MDIFSYCYFSYPILRRVRLFARRFFIIIFILALFSPSFSLNAEVIREIIFPVQGIYTFHDDFGDPRSGGRTHEGIDIISAKLTPVVSAVEGRVSYIVDPEASWGYALYIRDADGYEYRYLHLNNDTPGTDDGQGGPEHAYAPGIARGIRVTRGQMIGWVGDSGNAESAGAHLHFEIWNPQGQPVNPYQSLLRAAQQNLYDPAQERTTAPTISDDKGLVPLTDGRHCTAHALIKSSLNSAVYYCGVDAKRYVFPHLNIYLSWYDDFSSVVTVTPDELAAIPFGGNVTYRPGVRMVKLQTDPKVYAVSRGGVLRWVVSNEVAAGLYGAQWAKQVDDLSDAFFVNYRVGESIVSTSF